MTLAKLILVLLIYNIDGLGATITAFSVIGNSAEVRMENLLIEFMIDLTKINYENLDHDRLIVLGKKENFLQATEVLLEKGTPYFISTEAEATVLPSNFGENNFVLFFIDRFSDSELHLTLAKLPRDYKCKTLLISVEDIRTNESIATIINSAEEFQLTNVLFAGFDGQVMKIWGKVLNANCGREVTLLNKWKTKTGFGNNENIFEHKLIVNERGCPRFVSTFEMPPTMMLQKDEDKSFRITGGVEGNLVQCIAKHLNMVPVVKLPAVKEQFWITPDGTVSGIVGEVARGITSLGIGRIRPTLERTKLVDLTTSYNHECVVWTVPLRNEYKYNTVTSEFSLVTWITVILPVSLCCGLAYIIPKLEIGCKSSLTVFDVIAVSLNYAISHRPSGLLCKLFFLLYLHYSRIISTAYSTSLASILTTTTLEPVIFDEKGILAAGLRTAGSQSSLALLADQISPNSPRVDLINRYEVILSVEAALARITVHRDIAYLRHYSAINYAEKEILKAGKSIEFHPLPKCVLFYNSVMVTTKGSHLTGKVNKIIRRLAEAGIYSYWQNLVYTSDVKIKTLKFNNHSLSRLTSIFVLYLYCLIPALLAFVAELIAYKLKLNWFTP